MKRPREAEGGGGGKWREVQRGVGAIIWRPRGRKSKGERGNLKDIESFLTLQVADKE